MTTDLITPRHPRDQNHRWARYVKLAARGLYDDGVPVPEILAALAEHFPKEMKPILAKHDGGLSALRQRLNHMDTRGYEREHPANWADLEEQERILAESGWYHRTLL